VLTLAATLAAAGGAPPAAAPPDRTVIFEQEAWYRARPEPERNWSGTLRRRKVIAGPSARTALRYSLITPGDVIAVYAPTDRLEPFVDAAVLVRAKLIDLTSEGFGLELWPASIARASAREPRPSRVLATHHPDHAHRRAAGGGVTGRDRRR